LVSLFGGEILIGLPPGISSCLLNPFLGAVALSELGNMDSWLAKRSDRCSFKLGNNSEIYLCTSANNGTRARIVFYEMKN
jgi:hypothetical protein